MMPRTRRSSLNSSRRRQLSAAICSSSALPTVTRADEADRDGVRRQIEAGSARRAARAWPPCRPRPRRCCARRALRDGVHVHGRRTQRVEHLAGDARQTRHAVADHGEDGEVLVDLDALDLAFLDLAIERGGDHARGALGFDAGYGAADRMLRTTLRDEDDRDAFFAQRAEQSMRGAGHADHAGALHVHHRDVLDAEVMPLTGSLESGVAQISEPCFCGREGVADPDRNAAAHGRRHGLRMDDLGAEVRELHRLRCTTASR